MKRTTIFAVCFAAFLSASCDKGVETPVNPSFADRDVQLTVKVADAADTRATSVTAEGEKTINTLQVFVFRKDNEMALDVCGMAEQNSLSLKCSSGERVIYALANAPDIRSSVSCEADLLNSTTLLSDNTSATSLVMIGSTTKTLTTAGETVSVEVKRIAASVTINKISTNFVSDALNAGEFKVTNIYLVNVNGKNNYAINAETSEEAFWYNRLDKAANAFSTAGICADLNLNEVVTKSKAYDKVHTFYAYPNSQPYVSTPTWSIRATLLCVEASFTPVGGSAKTYYYPIAIDKLESNKKYIIPELVVTRLGSDTPSEEVTFSDCTFSVTVKDWDETTMNTETI